MDYALAVRMVAAVAVIALVLFALQIAMRGWARRQLSHAHGGRLVTVIETTTLPNAASLHVVKIGDEYVIIGRSGQHIARLGEIAPETVAAWLAGQSATGLSHGIAPALTNIIARMKRDRA